MALTQRDRIEHVAGIILGKLQVFGSTGEDYTLADATAQNAGDGWGFETSGGGVNNYLRYTDVHLSEWELAQAYALAGDMLDGTRYEWHDPRKTGRPPIYTEPREGILLEIPVALLSEVDTTRGETTRREWIERAIRAALPTD